MLGGLVTIKSHLLTNGTDWIQKSVTSGASTLWAWEAGFEKQLTEGHNKFQGQ